MVTDGSGALLSAGDHVMTVLDDPSRPETIAPSESTTTLYYHESVGGRFEGDGGFLGTHWRMWTTDTAEDDGSDAGGEVNAERVAASQVPPPEKRAATNEEARELRRLATDVLARAGVVRQR